MLNPAESRALVALILATGMNPNQIRTLAEIPRTDGLAGDLKLAKGERSKRGLSADELEAVCAVLSKLLSQAITPQNLKFYDPALDVRDSIRELLLKPSGASDAVAVKVEIIAWLAEGGLQREWSQAAQRFDTMSSAERRIAAAAAWERLSGQIFIDKDAGLAFQKKLTKRLDAWLYEPAMKTTAVMLLVGVSALAGYYLRGRSSDPSIVAEPFPPAPSGDRQGASQGTAPPHSSRSIAERDRPLPDVVPMPYPSPGAVPCAEDTRGCRQRGAICFPGSGTGAPSTTPLWCDCFDKNGDGRWMKDGKCEASETDSIPIDCRAGAVCTTEWATCVAIDEGGAMATRMCQGGRLEKGHSQPGKSQVPSGGMNPCEPNSRCNMEGGFCPYPDPKSGEIEFLHCRIETPGNGRYVRPPTRR